MELRRFCIGRRIGVLRMGNASVAYVAAAIGLAIMPYHIYIAGAGVVWIYAGIFAMLQIAFGWMSFRMMRYARKNSCVYTVPSFFKARLGLSNLGRTLIALILLFPVVVLYASVLSILGKLLQEFGLGEAYVYIILLVTVAFFVSVFIGIRASFLTSIPFVTITIIAIMGIVMVTIMRMGLGEIVRNTIWSDIRGSVSDYINVMKKGTRYLYAEEVVNYVSYGFMVFGYLPLLNTFLAAPTAKVIKKSRRLTALLAVLLFVCSAFLGGISRALLYPRETEQSLSGYIRVMFENLMGMDMLYKALAVLYAASILMLMLIISCTFLNIITAIIVNDLLSQFYIDKIQDTDERHRRENLLIVIVAFIMAGISAFAACGIKVDLIDFSIVIIMMISAAVGPAAFISLFMKKTSKAGFVAGFVTGIAVVLFWEYCPFVNNGIEAVSLRNYTGVNAMLPGFVLSAMAVIIISLVTWKSDEMLDNMFEEVKNRIV